MKCKHWGYLGVSSHNVPVDDSSICSVTSPHTSELDASREKDIAEMNTNNNSIMDLLNKKKKVSNPIQSNQSMDTDEIVNESTGITNKHEVKSLKCFLSCSS